MKHVIKSWLLIGLPAIILVVAAAAVTDRVNGVSDYYSLFTWMALLLAFLALGCEYVDSTLGMGYGTSLTPLLLLIGYEPLDVVPAILLSQLAGGLMAALLHHKVGNVDFRRGGQDIKIAIILAGCSLVGTIAAVFIAINLPKFYLRLYIGLLVLAMGLVILAMNGREGRFSWKKVLGLGVLASFNKGISGGGYGPIVTSGQILSGVAGKRAVGITSLAEGLTCIVGVAAFSIARGWINMELAMPLVVGAMCSTPLSAWSVSRMGTRNLTFFIAFATILLGAITIAEAVCQYQ